jgi:anti-sigma B factor antagonist
MQIDISERGRIMVVAPQGPRLDAEVAVELKAVLLELIEAGKSHLVVNLNSVDFIDTAGLGALISALKRVKLSGQHGDIRLAHVKPSVESVLEIIRLHRVFCRYGSVDDAVRSYSEVPRFIT